MLWSVRRIPRAFPVGSDSLLGASTCDFFALLICSLRQEDRGSGAVSHMPFGWCTAAPAPRAEFPSLELLPLARELRGCPGAGKFTSIHFSAGILLFHSTHNGLCKTMGTKGHADGTR